MTPSLQRLLDVPLLLLGLTPAWLGAQGPPSAAPSFPLPGTREFVSSAAYGHLLHFVVETAASTALGGIIEGHGPSLLGELHDLRVAGVVPGVWTEARSVHDLAEFNVWLGDEDADGLFYEAIGGEIDAMALRTQPSEGRAAQLEDWVFSFETPWGQANPAFPHDGLGALDGTLVALERDADGRLLVRRLLRESQILKALGQGNAPPEDDLDVDALALDAAGNVLLSFRSTEWVNGVLLADDGVVCIPAESMYRNGHGEVLWLETGGAVIVLDKAAVDALVSHANVAFPGGATLSSLTDLSGLAFDPAGGSFAGVEPVPGLEAGVPNLLFTGSKLGPTVLSTRKGGRAARLNGHSLAPSPLDGAPLGLVSGATDVAQQDLAALEVTWASSPEPLVMPELGLLDPTLNDRAVLLLENFSPHGTAWLLIDGWLPAFGGQALSTPWLGGGCSQRFVSGGLGLAPIALDGRGRARVELPGEASPGASLWLLAQAWDAATRRLSRPGSLWCHHGGSLAGGTPPD